MDLSLKKPGLLVSGFQNHSLGAQVRGYYSRLYVPEVQDLVASVKAQSYSY